MTQDITRTTLINGTIHIIASEGLDKATTKQIGNYTGINEAYIYRCFSSKEDMFVKTFDKLDRELFDVISERFEIMNMPNMSMETKCRLYFGTVWDFLLKNEEKCRTYVRYYYSPYFEKFSVEAHKLRYEPIVEKFKTAFKKEADVWMILNHILNVMLDFAIKVYNEQMPKDDNYSEHVFRVIYVSVKQYFKKTEEEECL